MKQIYTTFLIVFGLTFSFAQTTEYTTGQTYGDAWTGWTTPVTTSVNTTNFSANIYTFTLSGASGTNFSIETTRAFTIASNDIDIYLTATAQDATLSVEYSEDNTTWTGIGTPITFGSALGQSTLTIPTYAPGLTSFYLKIKIVGTVGSNASAKFNKLKIDAELSAGVSSNTTLSAALVYYNNELSINLDEEFALAIYDLSGKLIKKGNNIKKYDFFNLKQGIYFAKVTLADGTKKTLKIIR